MLQLLRQCSYLGLVKIIARYCIYKEDLLNILGYVSKCTIPVDVDVFIEVFEINRGNAIMFKRTRCKMHIPPNVA